MTIDPAMSLAEWKSLGTSIVVYSDTAPWWVGDWLLFGQGKFHRRYQEGLATTGLSYQTLRNYATVARRFPVSRRRDRLSFQHHAEVCALPDEDQEFWLDLAVDHRWSKTELRRRLRAAKPRPSPRQAAMHVILNLDAEREGRWREAASRSNHSFNDWITDVLDAAATAMLNGYPGRPHPALSHDVRSTLRLERGRGGPSPPRAPG
jgi:hypothetical protein